MTTYTYTGKLTIIECAKCHMNFGVSPQFEHDRRDDKRTFHCPAGHTQWFPGETTDQKLEAAEARNTHLEDQLRATSEESERHRQAILRDRRRFANGVCPACTRSFQNVRRHMTPQHPDYDVTHVDTTVEFGCQCGRTFGSLRGLRTHQGHQRHDAWWKPDTPRWRAHLTKI